jgi:outer membrane beta-barrel protein
MFGQQFKLVALFLAFAVSTFVNSTARASEKIEFPDEELAAESVLPVFDHPVSVKNKNILTAKRWEVGPTLGLSLLEPFYNPLSIGANVSYHLHEEAAVNVLLLSFMQGLSANAQGLNPIPGKPVSVNLQYAPAPKYLLLGSYQFTGFYGKISITKDFVMNLHVYGLGGLGAFGIGDSLNPAINVGIGQKLYFSKNWSLRLDFRLIGYQGPDVLSVNLSTKSSVQPASSFDQKLYFPTMLSASMVYLFPGT